MRSLSYHKRNSTIFRFRFYMFPPDITTKADSSLIFRKCGRNAHPTFGQLITFLGLVESPVIRDQPIKAQFVNKLVGATCQIIKVIQEQLRDKINRLKYYMNHRIIRAVLVGN